MKKKLLSLLCASLSSMGAVGYAQSADQEIAAVLSYGFVDLEGAKPSAIIVEYKKPVLASSISKNTFAVEDYAKQQIAKNGFQAAIEWDGDATPGNEGEITRVYVNSEAEPSKKGGTAEGKYVILELNTNYMLSGQNLMYTTSMLAGVKQTLPVQAADGKTIQPGDTFIRNYTESEETDTRKGKDTRIEKGFAKAEEGAQHEKQTRTVIMADPKKIILPQFAPGSGWTLHRIEDGNAFAATHCYSEYTGEYTDFSLPYAIYVPDAKALETYKGKIPVVLHMEHAGANSTDPMASLTSSMAAAKLTNPAFQKRHPAIVLVPQVDDAHRSTNDYVASSDANTAAWELLDAVLNQYKAYVDTSRIYGTGQSMGGMLLLNMAAQRDNFFAGMALVGAQWSNNYDKWVENSNSPARTPENDPTTFNGFGLDKDNYQNWYYMISDDNILVHTCTGDPMATGEWNAVKDYYQAAGKTIATASLDPYEPLSRQETIDWKLTRQQNDKPGGGILWGAFTRGAHMSTWKYGYQLDNPLEWLFAQRRSTEMKRGKLEQLKRPWLGRDAAGKILPGSGTAGLNSAQYTPEGASPVYKEGWTPESVRKAIAKS